MRKASQSRLLLTPRRARQRVLPKTAIICSHKAAELAEKAARSPGLLAAKPARTQQYKINPKGKYAHHYQANTNDAGKVHRGVPDARPPNPSRKHASPDTGSYCKKSGVPRELRTAEASAGGTTARVLIQQHKIKNKNGKQQLCLGQLNPSAPMRGMPILRHSFSPTNDVA